METPFPGMDPYLESPILWLDVHNRLLVHLANALTPLLGAHYYVAIEERTYLVEPDDIVLTGRADVAVLGQRAGDDAGPFSQPIRGAVTVELPLLEETTETYLEVWAKDRQRVVTVIEILSPANKRPGNGRDQYLRKRGQQLASPAHLVEIDLLRGSPPLPILGTFPTSDYRLLISRARQRPKATLLPFDLRQPIPSLTVPLPPPDPEPVVDLNLLLHNLADQAGYDMRIDYRTDPVPPLSPEDAAWADALLHSAGLR